MTVLKCKMCAGNLVPPQSGKYYTKCEFCGSTQTLSRMADGRAFQFNMGNELRRRGRFAEAIDTFQMIIDLDPTDAEAYWCRLLCRHGIAYEIDKEARKQVPVCKFDRMEMKKCGLLTDDEEFKKVLDLSDEETGAEYRAEAEAVAAAQRKIIDKVGEDITADFKDPLFLMAVREELGVGKNDPIFDTDAAEYINNIRIDSKVSNLAGIEHLTGLEYISFEPPINITSIDFSMNIQLKEMNISSGNRRDGKLKYLNVSSCKNLTQLECNDNPITTFDVSNCSKLESLCCCNNRLTTLDVSNCKDLIDLNCSENQLISLDVSNCSKLKWLDCYDNRLTTIDISKNTALQRLDCRNNYFPNKSAIIGRESIMDGENCDDYFKFDPQRKSDEQLRKEAEEMRRKEEERKKQEQERRKAQEMQSFEWQTQGLCHNCGGKFAGLIFKKCASCGAKK